jgi:hypothetical protein
MPIHGTKAVPRQRVIAKAEKDYGFLVLISNDSSIYRKLPGYTGGSIYMIIIITIYLIAAFVSIITLLIRDKKSDPQNVSPNYYTPSRVVYLCGLLGVITNISILFCSFISLTQTLLFIGLSFLSTLFCIIAYNFMISTSKISRIMLFFLLCSFFFLVISLLYPFVAFIYTIFIDPSHGGVRNYLFLYNM